MKSIAILLALCGACVAGEVRIEKNLDYLGGGRAEKADLYRPPAEMETGGSKFPGILIIHGGGWTGGKRDAAREINIGTTLAMRGYVCLSIDYALATPGHPTWPRNLQDCKRAVRWLRKNAAQYRIDAAHIGAIGGSAGGHLTACVAVMGPDSKLDPAEDAEISCRVQAAAPMYPHGASEMNFNHSMFPGPRDQFADLYKQASPIHHITPDDPPLLILHGTADKTTPLDQSTRFAERCKQVGVEHDLVIIEDAPHSFHLQPRQRDLRDLVGGFFDKQLKPAQSPKTP